ncbi:MAG: DUF4351 domain-containing protein, partial [Vulcanococcus sp.]
QLIKRQALAEGRAEGLEEGRAEGLLQGRQNEAAGLLLRQLQRRCGPLSDQQQQLIRSMPVERLEQLGEAVLDFESAADLRSWLG